ncbi:hypothetical protein AJ79_00591 [Helicocarpus griseus UAMH5409]|uniref:Cytochrome P450 monooxygenase n=1 Tax=Helicocarpus griseus UAMH5409 TaxID=1447875 RepID=A0A2B7YBK4_9EURO|nr:hypothetical protein AJ79_00591 [Helicocarpus griseus UAMH5409]
MGLRCFTVDTITSFSFARSVDAMDVPEFCAPIVQAMEDSILPMLVFRHFSFLRTIIMGLPPWLSVRINPDTAALVHMRQMLVKQVTDFSENPHLLNETPHKIIYHELMRPGAHKGGAMPTLKSLYEEAQVMVFAGADTVGNTLMMGIFNVLEQPDVLKKLKAELLNAWPDLNEAPRYQELEKLPYLTAVIKESLRISPGVPTPLPRIVPSAGATISSKYVPGGTIVGMSTTFIHNSEAIFKDAMTFNPDRWLGHKGQELDQWLVPFSTGPRSCLGMNLAWCELYIGFATLFRKFDMKLDGTRSSDLSCRDCFLPRYTGRHLRAFCEPVKA